MRLRFAILFLVPIRLRPAYAKFFHHRKGITPLNE